jgi:hypothetical protein
LDRLFPHAARSPTAAKIRIVYKLICQIDARQTLQTPCRAPENEKAQLMGRKSGSGHKEGRADLFKN